jgi:hypothetical protein
MPPRTMADRNIQTNYYSHLTDDGWEISAWNQKDRQGHARTRRSKILCRDCNEVWMSLIQDSAKPLITAMMAGHDIILTEADRKKIAIWASMTTMTSEFTHPPTMAVPRHQRERFRLEKEPPQAWYIWAGRYRGSEWETRFRHHAGKSRPLPLPKPLPPPTVKGNEINDTHSTAFVVGKMLLFVLGSTVLDFMNRPEEFQKAFQNDCGVASIWPHGSKSIRWLDLPLLGDADVNIIADFLPGLNEAINRQNR